MLSEEEMRSLRRGERLIDLQLRLWVVEAEPVVSLGLAMVLVRRRDEYKVISRRTPIEFAPPDWSES